MHACVTAKLYNFMKLQNQNLAERLAAAAAAPLPLPPAQSAAIVQNVAPTVMPGAGASDASAAKTARGRPRVETVQMTIRPTRELRDKLDQLAIQRAVSEARIITAQEIALEFLERALDVEASQA
jgi:hypothetical protein